MVSKWPIWSVKVWLTSPSGGSDWSTVTNRTLSQHCPGFAYYFARLFSAKPGNCYLANTYSSTKNVFQPFVNRIIQYYITAKKTDYKYGATCDITAVNISEGGGWVQLSLRLRGERSCCAVWRRSCRNRLEQAVCGVAVLINYPPLTVPAHQQYSCHLSRSTKKKKPKSAGKRHPNSDTGGQIRGEHTQISLPSLSFPAARRELILGRFV